MKRLVALALLGISALARAQETPPPSAPLIDPFTDLSATQEAWTGETPRKAQGQTMAGARVYTWCASCTYRAWARVNTTVTLRLDAAEEITSVINGDAATVEVRTHEAVANMAEVKARVVGADTSVKLLTRSGHLYAFWITTTDETARETPDLFIDVVLPERQIPVTTSARERAEQRAARHLASHLGPSAASAPDPPRIASPRAPTSDEWWMPTALTERERDRATLERLSAGTAPTPANEVATLYANLGIREFRPEELVFDLTVHASSEEAARVLAPQRVFRDNDWTWLDYGPSSAKRRFPAVMQVTEQTETPVDTVVYGEDSRFLVVKTVGDLVLRSGAHVLCIRQGRTPTGITATAPAQPPPNRGVRSTRVPKVVTLPPDPGARRDAWRRPMETRNDAPQTHARQPTPAPMEDAPPDPLPRADRAIPDTSHVAEEDREAALARAHAMRPTVPTPAPQPEPTPVPATPVTHVSEDVRETALARAHAEARPASAVEETTTTLTPEPAPTPEEETTPTPVATAPEEPADPTPPAEQVEVILSDPTPRSAALRETVAHHAGDAHAEDRVLRLARPQATALCRAVARAGVPCRFVAR